MTTIPRFFVTTNLELGHATSLPDDVHHHVNRVLRLQEEMELILFNGQGGEYLCRLTSVSKKSSDVMPVSFSSENRASVLAIHLGICILKKDAMDNVIVKATELGAASITPLTSEYCTVARNMMSKRWPHWAQMTLSASEQCGLNLPPILHPTTSIEHWTIEQTSDARIVALPGGGQLSRQSGPTPVRSASLLIGPEGGFSVTETAQAMRAGFSAAGFGERILRAETAPIVVMTILQNLWGDFSLTHENV